MKGVTFYEEYNGTESAGNVVAVEKQYSWQANVGDGNDTMYEAIGAIFLRPNSPVCVTATSATYLREKCKKVGEKAARKLHPRLFEYLREAGYEDAA